MTIKPEPNLHGCDAKIFEDWSGEKHYCERVTTSYHMIEDEASDYFELHFSKLEITKIFMRYIEKIDHDDPDYDPALDNLEAPTWAVCEETHTDAVPFWQIEIDE